MVSKRLWHQSSPYLNPSHRSLWQRHREVIIAFGCSAPCAWCRQLSWCTSFWERTGKRRTVIAEMALFTSLMQLHDSISTFYEQVLKSASVSFWHELFIIYGWWWLGFGFHRQVYYIHLALTALACSKTQLFSQHLFWMFIILLDVKTFGVCNLTLVLGMRDWGGGVSCVGFFSFFFFVGSIGRAFNLNLCLLPRLRETVLLSWCVGGLGYEVLYMCGLGDLDVKGRKQNFKMRWDWCALPLKESGSEGWWDCDFVSFFCNSEVPAPL